MESNKKQIMNKQDNEENILIIKKNMIKAKNNGYKYIIITYEGSGDSGAIENIIMSNNIPEYSWECPVDSKEITGSDRQTIEDWAYYEALYNVSDWYNNEGGYGFIVINVDDGTYEIKNNVRTTSINTESYSDKL